MWLMMILQVFPNLKDSVINRNSFFHSPQSFGESENSPLTFLNIPYMFSR